MSAQALIGQNVIQTATDTAHRNKISTTKIEGGEWLGEARHEGLKKKSKSYEGWSNTLWGRERETAGGSRKTEQHLNFGSNEGLGKRNKFWEMFLVGAIGQEKVG